MSRPTTITPVVLKSRARCDEILRAHGKLIRDRRLKMGLSVSEAAAKAGMSWNSWESVEMGRGGITLFALVKASSALELELFLEVEEE